MTRYVLYTDIRIPIKYQLLILGDAAKSKDHAWIWLYTPSWKWPYIQLSGNPGWLDAVGGRQGKLFAVWGT